MSDKKEKKNKKRFKHLFSEGSGFTNTSIFVDKETGVQYLVIKNGYGAGITPLLGKDGAPLLYQE